MSNITVTVKWGKQKLEAVPLQLDAPVIEFKAVLQSLTGVPAERQKIMGVKGGLPKDDATWEGLGVKQGQALMLMGTAEKVPEPPPDAPVFMEDLPPEERAKPSDNPAGLSNLGNTCYLNSSIQCLRMIPEVATALQNFEGSSAGGSSGVLFAMRELVTELERSRAVEEVRPFKFVGAFRSAFPMFAQQAEGGRGFMQQDAEECWSTLVTLLAQNLKLASGGERSDLPPSQPTLPHMEMLKSNLGDELFGIELRCKYKCLEGDEEPYTARESVRKLSCHITDKTAHLYNAVEGALTETIEKKSHTLDREAQYEKKCELLRLPPYMVVQFVRFAWRKDTAKRAKILRPISFPDVLDVRNLCAPELQACIAQHNNKLEAEAEAKAEAAKAAKAEAEGTKPDAQTDASMDVDAAPPAAAAPAAPAAPAAAAAAAPAEAASSSAAAASAPVEDVHALPCDNKTGRYELCGIITHQGRTAEGGHYVAWVKKNSKKWLVFDDETVAEVDAERIKELYGGGDWHIAYMCLYRKMETTSLE